MPGITTGNARVSGDAAAYPLAGYSREIDAAGELPHVAAE